MVEDKLSEAVLRAEFKVFDKVFEIKATIKKSEAIAGIIRAARKIPEIINTEVSGDSLTIFSTKSLKFDMEKIIKDQIKEVVGKPEGRIKDKEILEPRLTESSYISYVVVDVKDGDIVIESKDSFGPPDLTAVGALTSDDKK
jgi:hypothetical protein